jgi:protease-4
LLAVGFTLSLLLNVFLFVAVGFFFLVMIAVASNAGGGASGTPVIEKFHSGNRSAKDKIAVIRVDGVLLEGTLGFIHKQIEEAAEDKNVKAVVLRIESPGGSITASDDLHRRLTQLRDGDTEKKWTGKGTLVVSMGNIAASGGYYISMPAMTLVAERTTLTGSIGVYAALPNIAELSKKYGIKMDIIKRGEVKASGSMFKEMKPEERQVWDDMIGHAYDEFLAIVEEGRPNLKGKLREKIIDETRPVVDDEGQKTGGEFTYVRRRADGGVFTADAALKYGLIDKIGYLEDAIKEAKQAAGMGEDYKVITYERPFSLQEALFGVQASPPAESHLDLKRLAAGATPRIWYLAPGSEVAGMLTAAGQQP